MTTNLQSGAKIMKCQSKPRKLGIRRADWRHFFRPIIGILSLESGGYARSGVEGLILAGDSNGPPGFVVALIGVEGLILAGDSNKRKAKWTKARGVEGLILAGKKVVWDLNAALLSPPLRHLNRVITTFRGRSALAHQPVI